LEAEQKRLGMNDSEGIRGRLRSASAAVERILNDELPWISKADRDTLTISLLGMRRYETEYRLENTELAKLLFKQQYEQFSQALTQIVAADAMKAGLSQQVKAYTDAFDEWVASNGKVQPALAVIKTDTHDLLPAADAIIA